MIKDEHDEVPFMRQPLFILRWSEGKSMTEALLGSIGIYKHIQPSPWLRSLQSVAMTYKADGLGPRTYRTGRTRLTRTRFTRRNR